MSLYTIHDKDFLMKQEQYRDLMHDAHRARIAGRAEDSTARPSAWQTVARVVAGAALAGLLLTVAANAQAASLRANTAAAATGRPASVVASSAAQPYVDPFIARAAEPLTADEQRMLVKESRLDPSAARIKSRPVSAAARSAHGPTAREKYLALKLRQLE